MSLNLNGSDSDCLFGAKKAHLNGGECLNEAAERQAADSTAAPGRSDRRRYRPPISPPLVPTASSSALAVAYGFFFCRDPRP
ncbi:hypothetical protein E3N88_17007 [Mikania micrantha]|uniref:Uncharacterized protein n=1 Tax=Mikania micrantha TaxID=192012 RepID=A0A5N6NQQ8_9ASTR|nr:hypothetical protein E3N88_17007 [Mikania micrantha]